MRLDLNFLLQPANWSARGCLVIEALAPLSMVAKMPGKYYRSQPEPTEHMLYGLLENALGWHIAETDRAALIKKLQQRHGQPAAASGVGFKSLLQWHVRFGTMFTPPLMRYDDLWAQHLRGASFSGGSRNYDYHAIPIINAARAKENPVTFADTADAKKDAALLTDFQPGDKVHLNVIRPYFPQYYASPTPREYVLPEGAYKIVVETSPELAQRFIDALSDPAAPLYLGSNDGWIDVTWEAFS